MSKQLWLTAVLVLMFGVSVQAQTCVPATGGTYTLSQPIVLAPTPSPYAMVPVVRNGATYGQWMPVGSAAPAYAAPSPYAVAPRVGYRPLLPIARPPASYYVGRGLLGQPKVYVPGQPLRNALRYLSP